jgi:hypothetical protein
LPESPSSSQPHFAVSPRGIQDRHIAKLRTPGENFLFQQTQGWNTAFISFHLSGLTRAALHTYNSTSQLKQRRPMYVHTVQYVCDTTLCLYVASGYFFCCGIHA